MKMDITKGLEELDFTLNSKRQAWTENAEMRRKSCLKQIFRPVLFILAIGGCYNFSDLNDLVHVNGRKWTVKLILSYMYRLFILAILSLMAVRFILGFFFLPSQYHQMLGLCLVWITSLIANFLVSLKSTSCKYGHYEAAFQFWEEKIVPEFIDLQFECPVKSIKRRAVGVTVASCVCVTLNGIGVGLQVFQFGGASIYLAPLQENPYTLSLLMTFQMFATFVWFAPQANAIVLSRTLCRVFTAFNKYLANTIKNQENTIPSNLQRLRILHMDMSKLVSDLDKDLSYFYGFSFAFNMGLCVFALYQVMRTQMDTFTLAMYLFWFIVGILLIGVTATFAALVNEEVGIPNEGF